MKFKKQTHQEADEDGPEIQYMTMAQQLKETYLQYYQNGGKIDKILNGIQTQKNNMPYSNI